MNLPRSFRAMFKHYLDWRVRRLVQKRPVAAATVTVFHQVSRQQENNIMKKKLARHRSYSIFHPPLKNDIFTIGVKSVIKMSFLRSMGSTKRIASYGAWEANFWVLQHLRSETPTFFQHLYRRGVQKIEKPYSYGAWEAKKKCFIRSMGSICLSLATPLERSAHFFDHEVVTNSVPVELGGGISL